VPLHIQWAILPLLSSRSASPRFGRYSFESFPVPLRVGGWVSLGGSVRDLCPWLWTIAIRSSLHSIGVAVQNCCFYRSRFVLPLNSRYCCGIYFFAALKCISPYRVPRHLTPKVTSCAEVSIKHWRWRGNSAFVAVYFVMLFLRQSIRIFQRMPASVLRTLYISTVTWLSEFRCFDRIFHLVQTTPVVKDVVTHTTRQSFSDTRS